MPATKKGSKRRKGGGTRKKSGAKPPHKKLSPRQRVRKAQEKVLSEMDAIVGKICVAAKEGSHSAAKFAFDFARIPELQSPLEDGPSQKSLASLLLEKLNSSEEKGTSREEDTSGTVE